MTTTRAAGITAAAGTGLTQLLLYMLFRHINSLYKCIGTQDSLVAVSRIAKFSRLLRPVGPGLVSQSPSPGNLSQGPYPSSASESVTLTTT